MNDTVSQQVHILPQTHSLVRKDLKVPQILSLKDLVLVLLQRLADVNQLLIVVAQDGQFLFLMQQLHVEVRTGLILKHILLHPVDLKFRVLQRLIVTGHQTFQERIDQLFQRNIGTTESVKRADKFVAGGAVRILNIHQQQKILFNIKGQAVLPGTGIGRVRNL